LDAELKLPTGYHYTYGGQFENLKEAKAKLSVAVPVALVIILFLLFITLRSMREVLIVFTEIPLAAIGGIIALWARGMPFSISAGVGFVALFGVVVLNGIVLINQFNEFERQGITDINRRILNGCMLRLRPVLMTAQMDQIQEDAKKLIKFKETSTVDDLVDNIPYNINVSAEYSIFNNENHDILVGVLYRNQKS
jgi:Cu/Ag efflux pump CusA